MDYSMPGFPVHHQLLDLTQTHVHQVGDVIQPSHPLLSPSPPAFNPQYKIKSLKKSGGWGGEWSNSETYWVSVIKSPVLGVGWFLSLY